VHEEKMTETAFRKDILLPDLGTGSALFLMAFRGLAFGQSECRCLNRVYESHFGESAERVLAEIKALVRILGSAGRRRIRLAQPGCARVTHDEMSLLCLLSAGQREHVALRDAHLQWLLGCASAHTGVAELMTIVAWFEVFGLPFDGLPDSMSRPDVRTGLARLQVIGRA
jgi:hypothetical protein